MKRTLLLILALAINLSAWAYTREIIAVHSPSMGKDVMAAVVLPDNYHQMKDLAVVYLMHGCGDNFHAWHNNANASALADQYGVIIVMPDGGHHSWYWDSPKDPSFKYETFVIKELIPYVDSHYRTRADRTARAITGNSMGGHGALWLSFRHQDIFGAAGALSGGVDIRPFPKNWEIPSLLGTQEECPENWENYTVINQTHLLKPNSLKLAIDCGVQDFFYGVNCALHEKLLAEKIPHDFYSRPGGHTWSYWTNSVKYQFLFFSNYFKEAAQKSEK